MARTLRKQLSGWKPTAARIPGFVPWQAASPPPGSYDPTIDANYAAAGRGLFDLRQDVERANTRAGSDLSLAVGADGTSGVGQQKAWSLADNMRSRTRSQEDHGTATANLTRQYGNLGRSQAQQAQQAGAVGGGGLAQALLKRTANQGREQAGLDTSLSRTLADLSQSDQRIEKSAEDRVGGLTLDYNRGVEDRNQVQVPRAQREYTQFGLDSERQRSFQAAGAGLFEAPRRPANEFKSPGGTSYRVLKGKNGNKFMLADGRIVSARPA